MLSRATRSHPNSKACRDYAAKAYTALVQSLTIKKKLLRNQNHKEIRVVARMMEYLNRLTSAQVQHIEEAEENPIAPRLLNEIRSRVLLSGASLEHASTSKSAVTFAQSPKHQEELLKMIKERNEVAEFFL